MLHLHPKLSARGAVLESENVFVMTEERASIRISAP